MRWKVAIQEKKLDDLFSSFEKIQDEELKAYLSKYLCVRASGLVEYAFKNLVNDYTQGTSPVAIQKFVSLKLKNTSNLKYDRLFSILSSLNEKWGEDLEKLITDKQKAALNSIVSNRNNIAHGENDTVSYISMKDYYESVKEVVNHLKRIIRK